MEFKQLINRTPTKRQIREKLLLRRKLYPTDQKIHDDTIITRTLLSLDIIEKARALCTYISKQDEIGTFNLIRNILKRGLCAVVVPKVDGHNLKLFRIIDFKHLKESTFGVLEPDVMCQQIPIEYPEIFITPGVAFSIDGYRIGYGGGYYDWLFGKTSAIKVALAYDFQVLETVPHEDYDKQVDLVVTPTKIINCTKKVRL